MIQKPRLTILAVIFSVSTVLFFNATKPAKAFDFFDPFELMVETTLVTISSTVNAVLSTVLTLSDDIGSMADRILIMADNIGVMADRIVTTEEMITVVATSITETNNTTSAPLLTSPTEGEYVSISIPAVLTISTGATDYVLFFSNTADMNNATNIMVLGGDTTDAWTRMAGYATGDQLYMAVKVVDNGTMGEISNTVMVNLMQ